MSTQQEAKQMLLDKAQKDIIDLRNIVEEWRRDVGIPLSHLIEILATITQEYRLLKAVLGGGQ